MAGTARRALRTTLAACAAFYLCLYGLDQPVTATYALFAAVAMGGLSRIPGTGRQRAAVLVRSLPLAWALVTAGTFLAARTWSAVAGVLVIGFALAFGAAAGPRAAGASPGLQLLYILPCFPPYVPDTLGERLAGATLGIGLLILAEAFLLPETRDTPYAELVARACDTAARCTAELNRSPFALSPDAVAAAHAAGESLRPSRVSEAERPAGPGLRERALAHGGLAARTLLTRLTVLPAPAPGRPAPDGGPALLREAGRAAEETSAELRGAGPRAAAADALRLDRARAAAAGPPPPSVPPAAVLRRRAALLEVADATGALSTAADLAVRGRSVPQGRIDSGRFWYAGKRAPRLWWHRLAAHAGPRSVYFQNAVRISLALAAARTIAGLESLPHGFWAMLAALTLTRTTVAQTRVTVRQALTGTLVGALVTAAVLAVVGRDTTVYAVALPIVMLIAFSLGPVRGVGWAQGMFTLVVSLVFAQLAPATWRLAEIRVMDVVIGSVIGMVFGVLAWPRGAQEELHRAVATLLRAAATTVEGTTVAVAAGRPEDAPDDRPLHRALTLAESAFAQYQSEPRRHTGPAPDWQAALMAGHHVLWGSRRTVAAAGPGLDPAAGDWVRARTAEVAARLRRAAGGDGPGDGPEDPPGTGPAPDPAGAGTAPLWFFVAAAWLDGLTADLDRMAHVPRSVTSAPPGR